MKQLDSEFSKDVRLCCAVDKLLRSVMKFGRNHSLWFLGTHGLFWRLHQKAVSQPPKKPHLCKLLLSSFKFTSKELLRLVFGLGLILFNLP